MRFFLVYPLFPPFPPIVQSHKYTVFCILITGGIGGIGGTMHPRNFNFYCPYSSDISNDILLILPQLFIKNSYLISTFLHSLTDGL